MTLNRVHFIQDLTSFVGSTGNHNYSLFDKNANVSTGDVTLLLSSGYITPTHNQFKVEPTLQVPSFVSGTFVTNAPGGVGYLKFLLNGVDLDATTSISAGQYKQHFCKTLTEAEKKAIYYDARQGYYGQVLAISGINSPPNLYALELWYSGGYIDNNWGSSTTYEHILTKQFQSDLIDSNPIKHHWVPYSGTGKYATDETQLDLNGYFTNILNDGSDSNRYIYERTAKYTFSSPSYITAYPSENVRLKFNSTLPNFTYVNKPVLNLRYKWNVPGSGHNVSEYQPNQGIIQVFGQHSGMSGPHLIGVGSLFTVNSGTFSSTVNLGFIDPIEKSGALHHSNNVHTAEAFRDLNLVIEGVPSGYELMDASLDLYYSSGTNGTTPLYTVGGSIIRRTVNVPISGANGRMFWQGNFNYNNVYNSGYFPLWEQTGGVIRGGSTSGVYQNQAGAALNFDWRNYSKHGYIDSYNDTEAYYRNAVFLGHNNNATYVNCGNVLGSGDFSLFIHFAQSGLSVPRGMVLNKGDATSSEFNVYVDSFGDLNYYIYDQFGSPYGDSVSFHGNSIGLLVLSYIHGSGLAAWYGKCEPYSSLTYNFHAFSSARKLSSSTSQLTIGGYPSGFNPYNSDGYSFPGYLCQLGFAGSSIGSTQVYDQFDSYAGFNNYSGSRYIQFISPSGTQVVTDNNRRTFTLYNKSSYTCGATSQNIAWFDAPDYLAYGTIPMASSIYVEVDCEHTTNHPSGVNVLCHVDGTTYDTYCHGLIPSGTRKTLFLSPRKFTQPASADNFPIYATPNYVHLDAWYDSTIDYNTPTNKYRYNDNFYGDLKIYSLKLLVDGWSVANTGTNSVPLYSSGAYSYNNSVSLYAFGTYGYSGGVSLYSQGHVSNSGLLSLFTAGGVHVSGSVSLYASGLDTKTASFPLYTTGGVGVAVSGNTSLYTWSTSNSGIYKHLPLYLNCNLDPANALSIYTYGGGVNGSSSATLPLYLENRDDFVTGSVSLFLQNSWALNSGTLSLYCTTPSGTEGSIPGSSTLPLYICRSSESIAHRVSLYCAGPSTSSGNLSLYTVGGYSGINNSVGVYTFGNVPLTGRVQLYTNGY